MFNNILKEKEKEYFNNIVTFIESEYGKVLYGKDIGFGTKDYDINSDSTNKLIEKLTPDANYYRDFDEDFKEGLKKLNATFIDLQKTALEQKLSFDDLAKKTGLKNAQERIADQLKRHSDYEADPTMTQYVVNALKDFADWVCDLYCKHFGKDKNEAIPLLCKAFETMNRDAEKEKQPKEIKEMDKLWKNYYKTIELIHKESERDLSDAPQTDPNQPLGQQLGQPDLSNLIKERNEIEEQLGIGLIESILRSLLYSVKQTLILSNHNRQKT